MELFLFMLTFNSLKEPVNNRLTKQLNAYRGAKYYDLSIIFACMKLKTDNKLKLWITNFK